MSLIPQNKGLLDMRRYTVYLAYMLDLSLTGRSHSIYWYKIQFSKGDLVLQVHYIISPPFFFFFRVSTYDVYS